MDVHTARLATSPAATPPPSPPELRLTHEDGAVVAAEEGSIARGASKLSLLQRIDSVDPDSTKPRQKPHASARLRGIMAVVYPMSLGLLEGVTQLLVKALTAITAECNGRAWPTCCFASGWTWLFILTFCGVGVLTVVWLKIVYTRFEVTSGLPIEYGTVQFCSVLGGMIFYQEGGVMLGWQIAVTLIGLAIVLLGVSCSAMKTLPSCVIKQAQVTTLGAHK